MMSVEQIRVSRQAREMEDLMLSLMLLMTMTAVVEVNTSICFSFVKIWILTLIWGSKFGFQPPLELS